MRQANENYGFPAAACSSQANENYSLSELRAVQPCTAGLLRSTQLRQACDVDCLTQECSLREAGGCVQEHLASFEYYLLYLFELGGRHNLMPAVDGAGTLLGANHPVVYKVVDSSWGFAIWATFLSCRFLTTLLLRTTTPFVWWLTKQKYAQG